MKTLHQELEQYPQEDIYPFHMPGHKRQMEQLDTPFHNYSPYAYDITEITGFDNLHHPEGILLHTQNRAKALFRSESSYLLVNGSTSGILSAISATVSTGGVMIMARNAHRSAYHACYLNDIRPVYLYPKTHRNYGIALGITPQMVEDSLREHPEAEAVFLVSPTYEGIYSDIAAIAKIVHEYRKILIVDEAHGAHYGLAKECPESSMQCGADISIQSLHKTLPALTPAAVLHIGSHRVPKDKVERYLSIYQTSSPSYVIMGSMDYLFTLLEREGAERFAQLQRNLHRLMEECKGLVHLSLLTGQMLDERQHGQQDPCKFMIWSHHPSLTGSKLFEILREEFGMEMEMVAPRYVLGILTMMDTWEGVLRLRMALEKIDQRLGAITSNERKQEEEVVSLYPCLTAKMTIAKAWNARSCLCDLQEAAGKVSAEFAFVYPPGIPFVVPGEEISQECIERMKLYKDSGMQILGLREGEMDQIGIVSQE